jgi:tetratricopeptide (TPR) repeat protein
MPWVQYAVMSHIGEAPICCSSPNEAIQLQQEALAQTRQVNDTTFVALSLIFLGLAFFSRDDYPAARAHYLEALRHCRRYQLLPFLLMALGGLGMVATRQDQPERAVTLLTFFPPGYNAPRCSRSRTLSVPGFS